MLRKSLFAAALAATIAVAGTTNAQQNPPLSPSPVKRTIISKMDVPGSNYEVLTALLEVAPGFKAGRHFHPGVVYGYVTEGQFWLAPDGQPEKTLKVGEGLEIPLKAVHNEGNTGTTTAKLIVTYVVEKGQPLVTPVK